MSNSFKIIASIGVLLIGATLLFQHSSCGEPNVDHTSHRGPGLIAH